MNKLFTIGIPVYNEEGNIYHELDSIFGQYNINQLFKIIIVNDGSTDRTREEIIKFKKNNTYLKKNKIILKIINLDKNMGKSNALNIIFRRTNSNFLVLLDSDIVLENPNTLSLLLKPLQNSTNIGLVGGWMLNVPKSKYDIVGRLHRFSGNLIERIGLIVKSHPIIAWGGIMALRRDTYKLLKLPIKLKRTDAYKYLFIKSIGKDFFFKPEAKVTCYFNKNHTLRYFLKRNSSVRKIPENHKSSFGSLAIKEYRNPPISIILKCFFVQFAKSPIDGICYVFLKSLSFLNSLVYRKESSHKWRQSK